LGNDLSFDKFFPMAKIFFSVALATCSHGLFHVSFQLYLGIVSVTVAVQKDVADVFCLIAIVLAHFEPWMLFDLFEGRTLFSILAKYLLHQVLELSR